MANNFCSNCGNRINPNDYSCARCGNVTAQPMPYYPPQQPVYVIKQKTPGKGFGITSMIMGIVASLYAFYSVLFCFIFSTMQTIVGNPYFGQTFDYSVQYIYNSTVSMMSVMIFAYVLIFVVLALIFGFCAKKRGFYSAITKSGLVMGLISLGTSVITLIISLCI